jgi:hypothetical protein
MENKGNIPSTKIIKGLKIWKGGASLRIEYRWSAGMSPFMAILEEILMGILGAVFFLTAVIPMILAFKKGSPPWTIIIDGIFLLLGFLLLYRALALLINTTLFEITSGNLVIHHKPLPFVGLRSMTIPIMEITGVEWRKAGHVSTGDANPTFALKIGRASCRERVSERV